MAEIRTLAFVPARHAHEKSQVGKETGRYYRVTDDGELGELVVIQGYSERGADALARAGWKQWRDRWERDGYFYHYYIDAYQTGD